MTTDEGSDPRPGDHVYVEWLDAETGEPFKSLSGIFRLDADGGARLAADGGNPEYPEYIGDPKLRVTVRERADEHTALVERVALALARHDALGGGMSDNPWWYVSSGAAETAVAPVWEVVQRERARRPDADMVAAVARLRTLLSTRMLMSATGAAMAGPGDLVDVVHRVVEAHVSAQDALRRTRVVRPAPVVDHAGVTAALRTLATTLGAPAGSSDPVLMVAELARVLGRRHRRMCAALGVPEDTSPSALAARARELREPGAGAREHLDHYRDTLAEAVGLKGLPTWREVTEEIVNVVDALNSSRDEVERLKRDGSPGVVHKVDKAFLDLARKERDLERVKVDRLRSDVEEARKDVVLVRGVLDTACAAVADALGVPPSEVTIWDLNTRMQELAARVRAVPGVPLPHGVRPFSALRDSGLLWLVNRELFHPRGYALGLHMRDGVAHGWTLSGDGSEVWRFEDGVDMSREVAATLGRPVDDDTVSLDEVIAFGEERDRRDSVVDFAAALRGTTWNRLEMVGGDGRRHLIWERPADPPPVEEGGPAEEGMTHRPQRVWYRDSGPSEAPEGPRATVVSPNGVLWKWDGHHGKYVAWYAPGGMCTWAELLKQYGVLVEAVDWFTPPVGWANRIDEVLHFHGVRGEDYRNLSFALGNLVRSWIGSWAHDTGHAPGGEFWGPRSPAASATEAAEVDLDATRYRSHRTFTDMAGLVPGGVMARCHDCAWSQPAGPVSAVTLRGAHEREAEPVPIDTTKPLVFRTGDPEPHESVTRVQVPNSQVFTRVPVGVGGVPTGTAVSLGGGGDVRLGWRWQAGDGALLRWAQVLQRHGMAMELITPVVRPTRVRSHRTSAIELNHGGSVVLDADCHDCAWTARGAYNRVTRERTEHERTAPPVPVH